MKLFLKIISPALLIAGLYFIFRTPEIKQPPGILAPFPPLQKNIIKPNNWIYNKYNFTAVAEFEITCKVLRIRSYSNDKMSAFCPLDIAAGWAKMSDQSIVDKFNIKQQHRWFVWQTDNFPIPQGELEISCTNIHIIPSTEEVDDIINDVIRGNIIKLNGKLVNVKDYESNFTWETSTERNDTGGGACEILWVEDISILQ